MPKRALKFTAKVTLRSFSLMIKSAFFAALTLSLVSSKIPSTLEKIQSSGKLHMVSRNGPTTYYKGANGYTGFEYIVAKRFAKHLGVKLVVHDSDDLGQMLYDVANLKYDFAAAGLTVTPKRQLLVDFSSPYLDITQQLIYRQGEKRPHSPEDLIGKKILVIGNSSHSERLRELKKLIPGITWEERNDVEMLDLLEMVHNGDIDHTVVDSNAYDINNSVYPKARVAFDISEPQKLAWAFPQLKDKSLFNEARKFFAKEKTQTLIAETIDVFYGHLGKLDYSGALVFANRVETRLPKWKEKLQEAAEKYELDWQLLAALSYQESHWNPKAKSYTGVRGFMMLTRRTAKEMGVKNRLSADQSIFGGAKYFKKIHGRIPDRITEPDRTWLALASYNMGYGHVEDARKITELEGGNPDKWADVSQRVLHLEKRKYYKFTKHGYARGSEAVDYVQNIRNFHTIIAWSEKEKLEQIAEAEVPYMEDQFAKLNPVLTEAVKSIAVESL